MGQGECLANADGSDDNLVRVRRLASQALVDIFNSLGGNRWKNMEGWLTPGTDVKRWHGITVNAGKLVALNLISNDLEGTLPGAVSNLGTLRELNMSYNSGLVGVLPMEVGSMESLAVLHIYSAGIHGPIPESISQLHGLEELWLNGNRLTGRIPAGLGHLYHLRELYLNANELVGCIPSSFSKLTNLEGLNVSWNRLSGGFPACLGNMVSLRLLVLEGNAEIEERPPAEHGIELIQWMASKREALTCRLQLDSSNEPGELGGGAPMANGGKRAVKMSRTCEAQEKPVSEQRAISAKPLQLGTAVLEDRRAEAESQIATSSVIPGVSPSLQEVLQGEVGPPFHLAALRAFTAAEFMEENIDFLVEVNQFKAVDDSSLQEAAAALCSRFVAPGAPTEINLSGAVRAATMANMQRLLSLASTSQVPVSDKTGPAEMGMLSRDVFDQAEQQICSLTETDVFPRFMHSVNAQMKT